MTALNVQPTIPLPKIASAPGVSKPDRHAALKSAAKAFESSFIAEMLKSAGLGKTRDSFGGGAGEDAFSSLLVNSQADKISERGGFGLAESILRSMERAGGTDG